MITVCFIGYFLYHTRKLDFFPPHAILIKVHARVFETFHSLKKY